MSKRKNHSPEFKAKVALEALKGDLRGIANSQERECRQADQVMQLS